MLDEPFVGLDPKATFTLKEIMREMCREGMAIFFSTHVLDMAENFTSFDLKKINEMLTSYAEKACEIRTLAE